MDVGKSSSAWNLFMLKNKIKSTDTFKHYQE